MPSKAWDEITNQHSQTSMAAPWKFRNGYVTNSFIPHLIGHVITNVPAGIKVHPSEWKGPLVSLWKQNTLCMPISWARYGGAFYYILTQKWVHCSIISYWHMSSLYRFGSEKTMKPFVKLRWRLCHIITTFIGKSCKLLVFGMSFCQYYLAI